MNELPILFETHKALMNFIYSKEGEIIPSLEIALQQNIKEIKDLAEAAVEFQETCEGQIEVLKGQIKKRQLAKQHLEHVVEKMRGSIKEFLLFNSHRDLNGHENKWVISKTGRPTIQTELARPEEILPEKYIKTHVTYKIDSEAILRDWDELPDEIKKHFTRIDGYSLRTYPLANETKEISQ
jgi:hypothetical protein